MPQLKLLLSDRFIEKLNTIWPKLKLKSHEPINTPQALLAQNLSISEQTINAQLFEKEFPNINQNSYLVSIATAQAEAAGAYIFPQAPVLNESEFSELLSELNQFYEDITWEKINNQLLLAHFKNQSKFNLPPIEAVLGQNLQQYLIDDIQFAAFATEMQMMLEGLALNQKRKENKQQVVNFLWLWGITDEVTASTTIDMLVGDTVIHHKLADKLRIQYQSVEAFNHSANQSYSELTVIDLNDYYLKPCDETVVEQVLTKLKNDFSNKQISELNVITSTQSRTVKRRAWWPFG